ncbi:hypothetical protein DPMN_125676 [Dreissena polymorpha]|uniref:Uncharacterized protein n=1 Tax=Dreissena polymorpha TaxID=45954 RepID=A0A9D4GVQ6_DREPO|nr:hypothetical protein DPMN_125676 [Dreissena polymorpha]
MLPLKAEKLEWCGGGALPGKNNGFAFNGDLPSNEGLCCQFLTSSFSELTSSLSSM